MGLRELPSSPPRASFLPFSYSHSFPSNLQANFPASTRLRKETIMRKRRRRERVAKPEGIQEQRRIRGVGGGDRAVFDVEGRMREEGGII